ncbi:FadR/GntR family transcriptional regulator [Microvirga calopogonii]|uniref:FadR/GntR family transcriptional regulator n=1 Tax=Microvirga calopogonii TaxID=2078013 RepID=UPI000E0DE72A|nr:FadR/GntR family transcriptional regulator [Microvirga calopogonii]
MSAPIPLPDSSNFALGRLRVLLEEGFLEPGTRLPAERALAAQIGIGRRALRRAMEVLETEGRIWRHQGKGTFLGPRPVHPQMGLEELSSRTNPLEVMNVRLEIEPILARLAALYSSNGDVERLSHLVQRTASSSDADAYELWDSALHRAIAEAAGNSLLLAIFDLIDRIRQDMNWQALRERARSKDKLSAQVEQHRQIVTAIAQREAHAAEQAMREHLELVRDGLVKVMTSHLPDCIDGEIPGTTMSTEPKNQFRHGT